MKLYVFRTVPLSIVRSYSLYIQQWYISYRFVDSFRAAAGSGWNCSFILILLESCLQTCMTYSIAECTVNNSWRWTEELSETCRVSFPKKIWEISASSWFYYTEISQKSCERQHLWSFYSTIPVCACEGGGGVPELRQVFSNTFWPLSRKESIESLPELHSNCMPGVPVRRNCICIWSTIFAHTKKSSLKFRLPKHCNPVGRSLTVSAACVIAQQYSSATFFTFHFPSRIENTRRLFQIFYCNFLFF
jgi:hypothetical protein